MTTDAILIALDEEIRKLQQVRAMLSGPSSAEAKKSVGRPKGSTKSVAPIKTAKKRVLSE